MDSYDERQVVIALELSKTRREIGTLERRIPVLVTEAREVGMTWLQIGGSLGTTGQAAWERFGLTPEQKRQRSLPNTRGQLQLEQLELAATAPSRSDQGRVTGQSKSAKQTDESGQQQESGAAADRPLHLESVATTAKDRELRGDTP